MELSDLLVFKTVAEQGGITRAAEALHRVPSNVTARIQKLEQELATALFIREKNRLRISPAGERFLQYARQILTLSQQALDQLHPTTPTGKLKIGAMEATAASRLPAPLALFHTQYPEVNLEVQTRPSGILLDQLVTGELDIAFLADPIKDSRLTFMPAFLEKLTLVSHHEHKAIQQPVDLGDTPTLLTFNSRCAYRARLNHWLSQALVNVNAKTIEISSYHGLLACVTAGMGVGIIPESILKDYPYCERLKTHSLPPAITNCVTHLAWRHEALKANLTAFVNCLKETSNDLITNGHSDGSPLA